MSRTFIALFSALLALPSCYTFSKEGQIRIHDAPNREALARSTENIIVSKLVIWTRQDQCKLHQVICHKEWNRVPDQDNDPCFLISLHPYSNATIRQMGDVHVGYTLSSWSKDGLPVDDFHREFDLGDDPMIPDLLECF